MNLFDDMNTSTLVSRAIGESWKDLAIVSSEGDAQTQVQRGWAPEHVFVLDSVPLALLSQLPRCHSLERLALPNAKLGSLAEVLGQLEELTHLDIRGNELTQNDLSTILTSLSDLQFLDISSNHIASLQEVDFLSLRDSLRTLLLHNTGTDLTSIRQLGSLEFLEELSVSHNLADSTFLNRLSALPRLRKLNLSFCRVDEQAGVLLGRLPKLESLNLQNNPIGERTTRSLGMLEGLTELALFNIHLTDDALGHLATLKSLTSLSVSSTLISSQGVTALAALEALQHLTLFAERLHDDDHRFLENMQLLTRLHLRLGTVGEKMGQALGELPKLKALSVDSPRITHNILYALTAPLELLSVRAAHEIDAEWLDDIPRMPLRQLQLSSEAKIGDRGAKAISMVQTLAGLNLRSNDITPTGARHISRLTNLESLDLSDNPIGDDGAEAIGKILSLVRLELRACGIGPRGAKALGKLVNLKSLTLERNQIGDAGTLGFVGFPVLKHLDLLGNKIGNVGAEAFTSHAFPQLTSLNLPSNRISTRGAKAISLLPNLRTLSLSGNPVGDDALEALMSLRKLSSLYLTGSRIGPRGAEALGRMSSLVSLSLQNAPIGPDGARSLSRLHELQSLNIHGCAVGDIGVRLLLGMQRLKHLHASDNEVSVVSSPGVSVNLTGLHLANNRIKDDSLRKMCQEVDFRSLESLSLRGNRITDSGLSEIYRLPSLKTLDLCRNRLSRLPARLASLEHLSVLLVADNPLEPTEQEASKLGVSSLMEFLREKSKVASKRSCYELKPYCIAEGGQARVSEALDLASNRWVAFKECLFPNDTDAVARLRREIEASTELRHHNIMPVWDSSREEAWLTMPLALYTLEKYAGGMSLSDVDTLEVVGALLAALEHSHRRGWIHRDIKPSNILYVRTSEVGRWVLSDWGLVRRPLGKTTVPRRTKTGVCMGSEGFSAPELSGGANTAGPPCDLWSLGQVVGWMTTGEEPRQNIPLQGRGVWRHLTDLLTRLDPDDRPRSTAGVRTLFEQYVSDFREVADG